MMLMVYGLVQYWPGLDCYQSLSLRLQDMRSMGLAKYRISGMRPFCCRLKVEPKRASFFVENTGRRL